MKNAIAKLITGATIESAMTGYGIKKEDAVRLTETIITMIVADLEWNDCPIPRKDLQRVLKKLLD